MKKVIDLAKLEADEAKLVEELKRIRQLKAFAAKYGTDIGQNGEAAVLEAPSATVALALRTAILAFGTLEFNYQALEQAIANYPQKISRSSVFQFLAELKERGEIRTVRPGAGRRPAQLQATETFSPS